jgi:hypothetical protein
LRVAAVGAVGYLLALALLAVLSPEDSSVWLAALFVPSALIGIGFALAGVGYFLRGWTRGRQGPRW